MRRIAQFAIAGAAALSFAGFDAFAWPNKPMGWGYRKIRHGVRSKPALIANIRDPDCKTSKARWSIQLMRERKWFTTTWEYVAAMKKLTFAKCPTEALVLWQEMRARGMEETPATYTAAIVAYNSRGWWQKAVETLDEMMSIGMVRPLVWNLRAFSASLYGNCIVALEGFPCLSDFSFAGI